MKAFSVKTPKIGATRYPDIIKKARSVYHEIERRTKRRPYIRSAYFKKEKIFFDYFWVHLNQKLPSERRRRLRFFPCAIDLIENSRFEPFTELNRFKRDERLYRFTGATKDNELFFVQIKEDLKSKQKFLMSVFDGD
ncbi:MAG: hypothetical protein NUV80_05740 [Candidatus Berkelbacteria bacterium]|nr:hypothetical protein [Candidatus Berkelbacteria bacterium]